MARYYYAMSTPRGANTYSRGDMLYRFESMHDRDEWVLTAFRRNPSGDVTRSKRDFVTRDQARYWYPRAFASDAVTFPATNSFGDYWDEPDAENACEWLGSPTGGEYAHL